MKDIFHFQARRTEIAITIICIIIGFLLVTQLRGQATVTRSLGAQSEQNLGELIHELNRETDTLQSEVVELKFKLLDYQRKEADRKTILREAEASLRELKVIAGFTAVEGPGIRIQITDSEKLLSTFDFLDIVQELHVAGAEAVSINDIRVVTDTFFKKKGERIYINGKKVRPDYEIRAVGDPGTLYQGIMLAGGVESKLSSLEGVKISVKKESRLTLPVAK